MRVTKQHAIASFSYRLLSINHNKKNHQGKRRVISFIKRRRNNTLDFITNNRTRIYILLLPYY
jgi:hypothetical protein